MRVQHLQQTRPQYYDRISANVTQSYKALNVAPHATTTRATYTVPTAKLAYCDVMFAALIRSAASTVDGVSSLVFIYTPSGGGATDMVSTWIRDPNTGFHNENGPATFGFMQAGDVLALQSTDSATNGTINYQAAWKVSEMVR